MALYRIPVDVEWTGSGSPGVNVWHARTSAEIEVGVELQGLIDGLQAFYTSVSAIFPSSVKFTCPDEIVRDFHTTPEYATVDGWEVTGSASSPDYLPLATAIVVGWRTSSATRRGRGRTFLGPLSRSAMEGDGTPFSGAVTIVSDAAQALIASFDGLDNGAFGVWSETDQVLRDFTGSRVRDTFAVLRSRRD